MVVGREGGEQRILKEDVLQLTPLSFFHPFLFKFMKLRTIQDATPIKDICAVSSASALH